MGAEEKQKKMDEEKKSKNEREWGPCKPEAWDSVMKDPKQGELDEDEWVEQDMDPKNQMPVERKDDPADVIEINARLFKVEEFYLDTIVKNLKCDKNMTLSGQDRDLLDDALTISDSKKPNVKESTMRVASLIICDIIERINAFSDEEF